MGLLPLGGVWLTAHLWERYLFTQDMAYLAEQAYPLMKGAAAFCMDWLVEGPDGWLVTSPSTSPENKFKTPDGEDCSISMGSTMDMTLIRELLSNCIQAAELLELDDEFRNRCEETLQRLLPYQIGRHGQLQEWFADFEEAEPGHRHVSHLYGLYPVPTNSCSRYPGAGGGGPHISAPTARSWRRSYRLELRLVD